MLKIKNQAFLSLFEKLDKKINVRISARNKIVTDYKPIKLNSILKIKSLDPKWKLVISFDAALPLSERSAGVTYAEDKVIFLNLQHADLSSLYTTLLHEVNHAIQYDYDIPNGGNPTSISRNMPFLKHVWDNYKELVEQIFDYNDVTPFGLYSDSDINIFKDLDGRRRFLLAEAGYYLLHGEILSEKVMHNLNVKGYRLINHRLIIGPNGEMYIPTRSNSTEKKI